MLHLSRMQWMEGDKWEHTTIVPQNIGQALADARKLPKGTLILTSGGDSEVWLNPDGTWVELVTSQPRKENSKEDITKMVRMLLDQGFTPKEVGTKLCITTDRVNRIRENW